MKLIENAIGLFSPKAAARRAAWNKKRELLDGIPLDQRNYTGASRGKRVSNWNPGNQPADSYLARGGALLRGRAHDLVRNNPHAANIVARHADNIVGTGITPKWKIEGDEKGTALVNELWTAFSETIDPEGLLDFNGKTYQAVRGMISGGEIYARRRDRRRTDDLRVPLQIQLLEAEFCDWSRRSPYAVNSQNVVTQGIEFDLLGGRRGYWMFRQNPSSEQSALGIGFESVFVPAGEVAHLFEPLRAQVHGETWLAPIMMRLRDLEDYDSAEMIRKKTEACLVGVVIPETDDPDDEEDPNRIGLPVDREPVLDENGQPIEVEERAWAIEDANGDPVERMEPGMFYYARGGSKVEFNTPATSAGYDTYTRTQLRSIAAGARMPYEVMTGDLSEVTFASGRMGTVEYRRFVTNIQWNVVIPMWCRPIGRWFVDAIKLAQLIPENAVVQVEWTTPAFQSITPIDDVNADTAEVRAGFASWDEKVIARGYDPDVVADQIAKRNQFFDEKGIILDSDPRHVSKNGQRHSDPSGGEEGSTNAPGEQDREEAARRRRGEGHHPRDPARRGDRPG